jgi:hypothetical protein
MESSKNPVNDSKLFFYKKFHLKKKLDLLEKSIFEIQSQYPEIQSLISEMMDIAKKNQSAYFIHRVSQLNQFFQDFFQKHSYKKREFDRFQSLLYKIKESEASEFLGAAIHNKMEKIAKSLLEKTDYTSGFLPFEYKSIWFLIPNQKHKIIPNVSPKATKISIRKQHYFILPSGYEPDSKPQEAKSVIVFHTNPNKNLFQTFLFDRIGETFGVDGINIDKHLQIDESLPPYIKGIFHFSGKNYFFINQNFDSRVF